MSIAAGPAQWPRIRASARISSSAFSQRIAFQGSARIVNAKRRRALIKSRIRMKRALIVVGSVRCRVRDVRGEFRYCVAAEAAGAGFGAAVALGFAGKRTGASELAADDADTAGSAVGEMAPFSSPLIVHA